MKVQIKRQKRHKNINIIIRKKYGNIKKLIKIIIIKNNKVLIIFIIIQKRDNNLNFRKKILLLRIILNNDKDSFKIIKITRIDKIN